jgi:exodeoxyribonuclease VII large subunit
MSTAGGFFDFRDNLAARKGAAKPQPAPPVATSAQPAALTVSQVTDKIDRALRTGLPPHLLVKGEISNLKQGSSGILYFTMKDANACLNCVMWRSDAARLKFRPADGTEVLAGGRIAVYAQGGKYQLYVTSLAPLGSGALELALKQMRQKLEAEGLFAAERKKPLPRYPMRIALVTSRQTAALADMLKVLRRYPWLRLGVYPVPVQGDGAAARIAAAIAHLSACRDRIAFDVLLLARGGGSLEDLWQFNEEPVARAIAASRIPVVTGIGHEIDTSIADLVADHHAHTPTEAAQTIVAHWKTAAELLERAGARLRRATGHILSHARNRLEHVRRHEMFRRPLDRVHRLSQVLDDRQRAMALAIAQVLRSHQRRVAELSERLEAHRPQVLVARWRQRLGELERRLTECHPKHRLRLERQRLDTADSALRRAATSELVRAGLRLAGLAGRLEALSPTNVLKRGYSLTTIKKTGVVVRDARLLRPGDRLVTRFADGSAESVVADSKQLRLFE